MLALMRNKPLINEGLLECYGIFCNKVIFNNFLKVTRQTKASLFTRIVYSLYTSLSLSLVI